MCYMSESGSQPARVGVRELRQNLSVYLARVKAGETLEVTEHGQPVAQIGPRPVKPISIIDQMIAEGRAQPATFDHRDIPPPPKFPGRPLSEIILEMRDEETR
jgi:prevent-host-death family protein